MSEARDIPQKSYGILGQNSVTSALELAVEQVRTVGYAVLDGGYTQVQLEAIAREFDDTRAAYVASHGEARLRAADEFNTVRAPLTHGGRAFLDLALNARLLAALEQLIAGKFILNQQNGIVNPPRETYNQAAWHRDLPYQHFVSSRPLAVNALFCVDEFTCDNGATFVLPASHKSEAFPSEDYIRANAVQTEAPAGAYLLLDCMLFHAGGFNRSERPRRAVNHVYNIPYFKQQINIPRNMPQHDLSAEARRILGYDYQEPASVDDYLAQRAGKNA
jgi:ectoine hydroxylase-related dioxygenase (phytanoyl-CoA dioxygenase family)